MDPHEDFIRPTDEYAVGKEFNLFPYKPTEPHGTEMYRRRRLPADEIVGSIRGFDPTKDFTDTRARVRVEEHIRIGMNKQSQIFGLSIVKAPLNERPATEQQSLYHPVGSGQPITWNLVGKAVDVEYASSGSAGVKQIEEAADGRVCCEHAVYTYYRSLGKTGYPHIMPQFYGTWVMEIDDGFDDEGLQVKRYVCVLLLEYIHGYSIDELSYRSEENEGYFGKVAGFQRVDNTWTNVWMDEPTRALVVKKMLHGVVIGMHHGVQHHEANPANVFMTLRDGTNNTDLDELRVVLLDHTATQVWRKTVDSHFYGRMHCLEKLPYPLHPKQGCSVVALEDYVGWWPPAPKERPGEDLNEVFDAWMLSEDVFGPLEEARDVEAGLQGKEWPHKYAKYSTFDTLDVIEAQEPREMRKKAIREVIIPKVLSYLRMVKDEGRAELEDREKISEESDDESFEDSRIFLFHPSIPGYPNAKFPGVCLFSEIYQVTGPVARFARQIAGQGYIVAAPSSYHEFTGPEPLAYDVPGTDAGNAWKVEKTLESYDEDSRRTVDVLLGLPTCTGLIGSTGMCLGGHLAVRASLDPRITACVSYFATDIHSRTLGPHSAKNTSTTAPEGSTHTLDLLPTLAHAEVAMIFGVKDTHVPAEGRDLIRAKLREAGVTTSFYEFAWAQHAFIRDELSKGRYDPAITKVCFEVLLELFGRVLKTDLGAPEVVGEPEHVC
ncbi:hypothetical protein K4K52_007265 [Colletotrichum sp. SAR 10_76]|nr:hypothetical protein K4K52_007265 [Colletotrichum sp. SAR 10_76]